MQKILIVVVAALLLLGIGAINGCRHERHPGAELMVDYLAETLDLNEAQREQIESIKSELLEKGKGMRARHFASAGEFKSLLAADELDQERVRQMVAEHRAQMDGLADLAITRLAEFHRTLSAEQKAKLIEKLERFRKWHGSRLAGGREG